MKPGYGWLAVLSGAWVVALWLSASGASAGPGRPEQAPPAPEFTQTAPDQWINSPPLRLADLRGKVVLIDFWTFDCWNCYRSFPWLNDLARRLAPRGLVVVGVHSPEFQHERDPASVRHKVAEFGLRHPVMLDNDLRYWRALDNQYWPAYYLVDKRGRLRTHFYGETHAGDPRAQRIEQAIETLLAE
jgi:thiol-disulfide isomerase/thioredoxin